MNMKNRLPSIITGISKGKLNSHVTLKWRSKPLSVIITSSSVEDMQLEVGDDVDVIFKASDVIVAKELSGQISARNIMHGTVSDVREGFPLALVTIDTGEDKVSAELTLSSLKDMNIKIGDELDAVIKSSELILAKKTVNHRGTEARRK